LRLLDGDDLAAFLHAGLGGFRAFPFRQAALGGPQTAFGQAVGHIAAVGGRSRRRRRLGGLLRRHRWNEPREVAPPADVYTFAGRTIDFAAMEVRSGDKSYHLTVMECDLLRYLVGKAGQPVSRKAILQEVWNLHEGVDTRAIDNFIVRLRRYIEDRPGSPRFLQTVRGVGYRFVPQP
jgi:DNA-binding response OmpR family regulator